MMTTFANRYEIQSELGQGSFGVVYRAHDMTLDRDVALKVLHPALTMDAATVRLFTREAGTLAKLDHDNIVPVYDMGVSDGARYIVMRHVPGRSLAQVLVDEGPQSPYRVAAWLVQIAAGLDFAHSRGVLHRDLKPSNLLLDEERDRVLISDFGLARAVENSGGSSSDQSRQSMTGTVLYMAPEILQGGIATPASDLYSLGCVLYELLTGAPPYTGDNPMAVMFQHVQTPAPVLDLPGMAEEALACRVAALLSKDPAQRSVSAQATVAAPEASAEPSMPVTPMEPTAAPIVTYSAPATDDNMSALPPEPQVDAPPVGVAQRRPQLVGAMLAMLLLIAVLAMALTLVNNMGNEANAVATTQAASTRAVARARATSTAAARHAAASTATAVAAERPAAKKSSTPTRTRTPAPTRTRTPIPTRTPTSRAVVAVPSTARVTLIAPADASTAASTVTYRWSANFQLPPGQAFEVVVWRKGEDPLRDGLGWGGSTTSTETTIKWDKLPVARDYYYWGVLLVQSDPYVRIKYLGGANGFSLQPTRTPVPDHEE